MIKADLISAAVRRTGLSWREASRGVEATLEAIKRRLGQDEVIHIRGLGRLEIRSKKSGLLPANKGSPPQPIPAGRAVKLIPSRIAVRSLSEPQEPHTLTSGGNMEKTLDNESGASQAGQGETAALGLDVGTSRLVLASGSADHVKTSAELNAFVTVPYSKFTENILKQNNVSYQVNGSQSIQIYGNDTDRFANFFNAEARRPMRDGMLNPNEEYSLPVMQAIVQQLLKKTKKGELLRFSIPGVLRDGGSVDLVYHEAMLKDLFTSMGYNAKAVNEGLAVVFAELEDENFTGIGVSCGGGMCNVCVAYMSVPVITFSIAKAGDYIDRSVASVTGELATRIRAIKEEGFDLSKAPQNKYESALHIYYNDVIVTLVQNLRTALAETKNLPRIDKPIPIVLSGGTSKPKGFLDKFYQEIVRDGFPLEVSEIRMAKSPLTTTARGCLIAALYDA
jgi:nucleoid DNA-binding protein